MAAPGIAVPGTVVPIGSLTTPGGAQGPTAVSADAGNIATLGSDSLILVPQSTLWSTRLRSFNAIGNPTFEVDQRNVGNTVANPANGSFLLDRWVLTKGGTMVMATQQFGVPISGSLVVPGTNFKISNNYLLVTLTTQQATLAAGDLWSIPQVIEGSMLREIVGDVSSLSLMVASTVAGLKFSVALRDPGPATKSLVKLCTIPSANTWTLIPLPNLPQFPSGGNFSVSPGGAGYQLSICLACGTTYTAPAADTWQNGNFVAAPGADNFASKPVNSQFQVGFVQHEPGSQCTTLIDKPFTQNYDECLRYFCKSYDYDVAIGSASAQAGMICPIPTSTSGFESVIRYPKSMAKIPTLTCYNPVTGAANSLRHGNGTDYAAMGFNNVGKSGFQGLGTAVLPALAVGQILRMHYTADTSW